MEILCEHNWKNQPSSQNQTNKIFIYYQTCEKKELQCRIRAHNLTINMFDLDKHQIIESIFTNKIISYYI